VLGRDPAAERRESTVAQLCGAYMERYARKRLTERTRVDRRWAIDKVITQRWGRLKAKELTRGGVARGLTAKRSRKPSLTK
jgi:hypothetical protein